jgi:hypothetical protein
MFQYEGQNQMEAFYAVNGFTLIIVAGIIIIKIKGQGKLLEKHKALEMEALRVNIKSQQAIIDNQK